MIARLGILVSVAFVSTVWATEGTEDLSRKLTTVWTANGGSTHTIELLPPQLKILLESTETSTPSSTGDQEITDSIIGKDERTRVSDTTAYPYRTIGRIERGCTGTLIGPRHVLTAGHCVYDIRADKWRDRLDFSPGRNAGEYPFGTVEWDRALAMKGWTEDHDTQFDLAVIVLKEDVGNRLGYQGVAVRARLDDMTLQITGYPGDKIRGTLWQSECAFTRILSQSVYYPCDTFGGQSGSALVARAPGATDSLIYGVHTNGGLNSNRGVRFTQAVLAQLREWLRRE